MHSIDCLINYFCVEVRGVQKTEEPKKPIQTDRTDAKISVRFRFGSVSVLLNKKPTSSVRFSVSNLNNPNRPNRTEIYIIL